MKSNARYDLMLYVVLAFFMCVNTGCFTVKNRPGFTYEKLEPTEYNALLADSTDHALVDVRTNGEYKRSHMKGAVNKSYLAFNYRKAFSGIDRNKLLFVYCQTCHRSPLAARKLKRMGFRRVVDLKGGYQQWQKERERQEASVE